MKKNYILLSILFGVVMPLCAMAADDSSSSSAPDKFDPLVEPVYRTTFPEAPNMVFDVPPDTRVVKVGAGIQVESQYHYLSRKLIAQERRMDVFNQRLEKIEKRLDTLDQRIKKIEDLATKKETPLQANIA